MDLTERYEAKVDRLGGLDACHPWTGALNRSHSHRYPAYGQIKVNGAARLAHRIGWELKFGPIPSKFQVLHTCDNPPCQNERHWFLGTHQDNTNDKVSKGRARGRNSRKLVMPL